MFRSWAGSKRPRARERTRPSPEAVPEPIWLYPTQQLELLEKAADNLERAAEQKSDEERLRKLLVAAHKAAGECWVEVGKARTRRQDASRRGVRQPTLAALDQALWALEEAHARHSAHVADTAKVHRELQEQIRASSARNGGYDDLVGAVVALCLEVEVYLDAGMPGLVYPVKQDFVRRTTSVRGRIERNSDVLSHLQAARYGFGAAITGYLAAGASQQQVPRSDNPRRDWRKVWPSKSRVARWTGRESSGIPAEASANADASANANAGAGANAKADARARTPIRRSTPNRTDNRTPSRTPNRMPKTSSAGASSSAR